MKVRRELEVMQVAIREFYEKLNTLVDKTQPSEIWNMDEVGVYFEPFMSKTLNLKEEKNVGIITLQAHHMRLTFILMISSHGKLAPPALLYYIPYVINLETFDFFHQFLQKMILQI